MPAGYVYLHTLLPHAESSTLNASAQDSQHDSYFDPDMLTEEATSTGLYTICCVVMQLTFILKTRAAYRATLAVMSSIDRMAWDFGDYHYPETADTVKYIVKDILICIIIEQCSDQAESQ